MKLRLIDVMFRPVRTSRALIKLLRDVHLNVQFEEPRAPEVKSGFVVLASKYMMPSSTYNMIKQDLVVVDYDYKGGKIWKRNHEQKVSVDEVPFETAVVMLVNERLDKAT
jgi:hypothetical protein